MKAMSETVSEDAVEQLLSSCVPNRLVTPFVRKYGRFFEGQPLPKKYRSGGIQVCFANSYRMALRHQLIYVEGYAIPAHSSLGTLHAWCVDHNGMVLDRTWRPAKAYFGIPFQTQFLKRTIAARRKGLGEEYYFGLLDDWQSGHSLIEELGDMPELWLENLATPKLKLVHRR